MGRPTCFRCLSLIQRSQNLVQVVHQSESVCHESVLEAKRSCFESIGPGEGQLLYKTENVSPHSCGLEGKFTAGFRRLNTNLSCSVDSGSKMQNCNNEIAYQINFSNCSFPGFEQELICLGSWQGPGGDSFIGIMDKETKHLKCGLMHKTGAKTVLSLSTSADCKDFHGSRKNAYEEYTFQEIPSNYKFVPCRFPEWLQGEYEGLAVRNETIKFHLPNSPSLTSLCVEVEDERVLVYSQASCGDAIGYHCLWFKSRSNSVVEFKTTPLSFDLGSCSNEAAFQNSSWTTVISKSLQKQPCAFFGGYSTPIEMRINDCFNLTVDCRTRDEFKLVAYHCDTGTAYDVKKYHCYGTWKENDNLYVYTKSDDSQKDDNCFISRQQSGLLYLSMLGGHCSRTFNFSKNTDTTLVLQRTDDCTSFKPSGSLKMGKKQTTAAVRYAPRVTSFGTRDYLINTPPSTPISRAWPCCFDLSLLLIPFLLF